MKVLYGGARLHQLHCAQFFPTIDSMYLLRREPLFQPKEVVMGKPVTFTVKVPLKVESCSCDGCDSGHGEFELEVEIRGVLYTDWDEGLRIAPDGYGEVKEAKRVWGSPHMQVKVW